MTDALLNTLTDYGALGIFAAFLVWQFVGLQRRLDSLVERFQTQLDKINADYDQRIEAMRTRYDAVIEKGRGESNAAQKDFAKIREGVQQEVTAKLLDNGRTLKTVVEKLDEALHELRESR